MVSCRIVIQDEVNVKVENLPVEYRRKIANKLKFQVPYARYLPQYKLGRWDGNISFFGIGGTGYVNHLDIIVNTLVDAGVEIAEITDNRVKHDLSFDIIDENYWAGKTWPKGHPAEGEPIVLRDYQVEVINNFLKNPQRLALSIPLIATLLLGLAAALLVLAIFPLIATHLLFPVENVTNLTSQAT